MASLPQQPDSAPNDASEGSNSQDTAADVPSLNRDDTAPSSTSIDSQTVLLNDNTRNSSPRPNLTRAHTYPRKCWICFGDESEDTPTTSAWKSPCPCALTAHEACLLDWVADLELPARRDGRNGKIECPQCKSPIRIQRPKSVVVDAVKRVDRFLAQLTGPGILLTVAGCGIAGAWVHGLVSLYVVFGPEDFDRMLQHSSSEGTNVRAACGATLIPFALIASRTTAADSVLPVMPVLFFATQYSEHRRAATLWPPSPGVAFASLPYIRGVYNILWNHLFAAKEEQWTREVQLRADGEDVLAQGDGGAGDQRADQAGGGGLAINVELEVIDEDEDDGAAGENGAQANDDGEQAADRPEGGQQQNGQGNRRRGRIRDLNTGGGIADAVMGALCFPVVAAAAGEMLRLVLPATWVVPDWRRKPGLLQTRWGRSLVGGCLFVVTKDTVLLYFRYRMAQSHLRRKILDYDRNAPAQANRRT